LPAHAIDAYEVAAADAAAASAAGAATPNVGKFNAAAGGSDGTGTAPIAATAPAIAATPNAAAPAIRADAADSKFIAQAAAPSESVPALGIDADNVHKTEHMHVLRSNSLDFSHPHSPPPPLLEPSTSTEAIHGADTPVDASPETGTPAGIRAAVAPAEVTAATAAVPAEASADAVVATGSTENLGARIAALGGRARRLVDKKPNAVVVVGGSDGSGTRSVVALLEKLGVFMVVDDRGTNDVHAAEMGGWPPVVSGLMADAVVVMEAASAFVSRSLLSNHRHQDVHAMHTVGTFLEMLKEYWKTRNRRVLSSADICTISVPAPFCLSSR